MAYTPETIVPHQKITSAWGNKIEQHLARLGNYLGVISDASALPDPSTVSEGDWYVLSSKPGVIYVNAGGAWRSIVDEDIAKLWSAEPSASTKFSGAGPSFSVDSKLPVQKAELTLYPITVVNLLGKYGNFETDSNADGIADGIYVREGTGSLDGGLIGTYAQKVTGAGSNSVFGLRRYILSVDLNEKYFVRAYSKLSDITNAVGHGIYYSPYGATPGSINWIDRELTPSTSWSLKTATFEVVTAGDIWIEVNGVFADAASTLNVDLWVDGLAVYNLTAMGMLPPPLQEFFSSAGITRWDELATTTNITGADGRTQTGNGWLAELLPYVDSVASVGYSFTDGQLAVTVKNRGKNLWDDDAVQIITSGTPPAGDGITRIGAHEWRVVDSSTSASLVFVMPMSLKKGATYTLRLRSSGNISVGSLYFDPAVDGDTFVIGSVDATVPSDFSYTFTYNGDITTGYFKMATYYTSTSDGIIYDIQLEESSSASEYVPALREKIELHGIELYGYGDVYDYVDGDTLVKYWTREAGVSIAAGAGTVSQSGTGKVVLVNESNGEVYIGSATGTSIEGPYKDVSGETPSGTTDGTNTSFSTVNAPLKPGTLSVLVDGATTVTDNGDGTLSDGGTVDYSTGSYTLASAPTTSINNDYAYYTVPDGTYTAIYRLSGPSYGLLDYKPTLLLLPETNHITTSTSLVALSIKGTADSVDAVSSFVDQHEPVAIVISSDQEPVIRRAGQTFWFEKSVGSLKVWDGSAWVMTGGQPVTVGTTEPSTKIAYVTMWFDTNENALKLWDGAQWIYIAPRLDPATGYAIYGP